MADSIDQSFNGLSLQGHHDQSQQHHLYQQGLTPQSSLRQQPSMQGFNTDGGATSSPYQTSAQTAPQSASARFEQFFASGGPAPGGQSSHGVGMDYGQPSAAAGLAAGGAFGSFGHALAPGTMGGSGHFGSSSLRKTARSGLPSQWGGDPASLSPSSGGSPPHHTASPGYFPQSSSQPGSGFLSTGNAGDDDIIPTAIVVKNIPFSIKREQLLQIIEDLQIPMPYAFNYHFDQGVFRGLAFANFRSGEEADAVVAALNGFDVSGRKLRVEYKKVLQAGEKERIEKEKAIKRMQSMQLEKERERERRRQEEYASHHYLMPGAPQMPQPIGGQETQYGDASAYSTQSPTIGEPTLSPPAPPRAPLTADSLRGVPATINGQSGGAPSERSGGASTSKKDELDLNDPQTLEIYSRVLLFKDDRMRDELSFSRNLSPLERRTVHVVAQKLGLFHYSMGEGEERYVVVTKNEVPQSHKPLRSQASTVGRANRGGDLLSPGGSQYNGLLGPGSSATTGRAGLRMKKSAPDMKRNMADRESFNSGNGMLAPGAGLVSRKSNSNLREGYSATMGRRPQAGGIGGAAGLQSMFSSPFEVPPVPSLGSASGPPGLDSPLSNSNNLLRQPRGPPATGSSESRNFAVRSRVQVGSVSSPSSGTLQLPDTHSHHGSTSNANEGANGLSSASRMDQSQHANLDEMDVRSHSPLEI